MTGGQPPPPAPSLSIECRAHISNHKVTNHLVKATLQKQFQASIQVDVPTALTTKALTHVEVDGT